YGRELDGAVAVVGFETAVGGGGAGPAGARRERRSGGRPHGSSTGRAVLLTALLVTQLGAVAALVYLTGRGPSAPLGVDSTIHLGGNARPAAPDRSAPAPIGTPRILHAVAATADPSLIAPLAREPVSALVADAY